MTRRARVPIAGLAPGERTLGADVVRHLVGALRLREGDRFLAFDPARALEADCEVVAIAGGEVRAEVGPLRPAPLVATRGVTWVQGLLKGDKMDAVVRDATELGATRVIPTATSFGVVKLEGRRGEERRRRWERIALEAARQCGRSDAPVVLPLHDWSAAVADACAHAAAVFCLYERARATEPLGPPLADALAVDAPVAFLAGPEGGLSSDEVEAARAAGARVVSLGPFVLRAETVAAATLGAVRVLGGMTRPVD